jgi:predicted deacetylase
MFSKIKNYITENTGILIRLDDIAENMNWDLMKKLELLFEKHAIKPVLGVIPKNKDTDLLAYPKKDDFWEKVREWSSRGWEISMHGCTHVYETNSGKKDYFGYGGNSEFCEKSLENQIIKIKDGLNKFEEEKIKVRSFFAPNHTYDKNTFEALKKHGINEIIDGYGLMPYLENGIKFIPQLFYKVTLLPFGIQTTQIHLNYWKQEDYDNFENFVIKNSKKIITYDEAIKKVNNNIFYKIANLSIKQILQIKRVIKK